MSMFKELKKESADELFYPNMCHVCHSFGEVNLKICGSCKMISYCSQKHQKKDWPNHKQFCKVIGQIKKERKVDHVYQLLLNKDSDAKMSMGPCKNVEEFFSLVNLNLSLSLLVKQMLQRELNSIEYQMLHFPRVCAVCYEYKTPLTNCKKCPLASFCKEHLNDPGHESECSKILSCYRFTTKKDLSTQHQIWIYSTLIVNNLQLGLFYSPEIKPTSMSQFLEMRFQKHLARFNRVPFNFISHDTYETTLLFNVIQSVRYSESLTLFFAFEKLDLQKNSMVIHIVDAFDMKQSLTDWEIIFHLLPQLNLLRLVFICPELEDSIKRKELCHICEDKTKLLFIIQKKALYREYCKEEEFLEPDMIVCFNPGFYANETFKESIQDFNKGQCPLLVTTVHATEGLLDKELIDSTYPSAKCIFNDYNPFGCLKFSRETFLTPAAANSQFMFLYDYLDLEDDVYNNFIMKMMKALL